MLKSRLQGLSWLFAACLGSLATVSTTSLAQQPWGWGWGWDYPPCYSCGIIIGPDNPLRRQGEGSGQANAPLVDPNYLSDGDAIARLRVAGADLVYRLPYSCANFYGQSWFSDAHRVYADFGPDLNPGGGNDAIWTCATGDGNYLYKSSCQSGTARADGLGCESFSK